jgi:hypothetical protein
MHTPIHVTVSINLWYSDLLQKLVIFTSRFFFLLCEINYVVDSQKYFLASVFYHDVISDPDCFFTLHAIPRLSSFFITTLFWRSTVENCTSCWIWGSHSGDCEIFSLLGYNTLLSGESHPKHQSTSTGLHSAISQNIELFIVHHLQS